MRVAVCFWGLCRSTDRVIESIEDYILNPLYSAGIVVDVFCHTYKVYRSYTNERAKEYNIQLKNTNWKLLRPKEAIAENQDQVDRSLKLDSYRTHGDPWKDDGGVPFQTLDNHIRALYSLFQCTKLWTQQEVRYDAVMYVRPDCKYLSLLNPAWIQQVATGTVLIPDFHLFYGCNDRFAIGRPQEMRIYGERFTSAHQYSLHKPLHSEAFLADTMKEHGIQFQLVPIRFQRIRADGGVCEADQDV